MLAKLEGGFYFYLNNKRHGILATNCSCAWKSDEKVDEDVKEWFFIGRPFHNYEVTLETDQLILSIKTELFSSSLTLKAHSIEEILPLVLDQLALNEPKKTKNDIFEAKVKAKLKKREDTFARSKMINAAFKIAYLGWEFDGLARQINTDNTIEEIFLQACQKCCLIFAAKDYKLTRCGRTDKGVSAFSQVLSLYVRSVDKEDGGDDLPYIAMLNKVLPDHIRILAWAPVGLEFDARFQVLHRTYKYYFPRCDLDIELMTKASQQFIGTHYFRGFCKADRTLDNPNYERTITFISIDLISEDKDPAFSIYGITILGHAFLWHQIRNMISVLMRIGLKLDQPKVISEIFADRVKYNYGMASDVPLVLYECDFENVDWIYDDEVNLDRLWFDLSMKTTLTKELIKILPRQSSITVKGTSVLCDTKSQSIKSRPFIR